GSRAAHSRSPSIGREQCSPRGPSTTWPSSRASWPRRSGDGTRSMPEHLDRLTDSLARDTSRRGFLARVGGALMAVTAARTVGSLIEPGKSDAFHFCGHTFTTGSCPHPTGLPRIDSRGFPLRASDGHQIDDIGRPVNEAGQPVDDDGQLLKGPDG